LDGTLHISDTVHVWRHAVILKCNHDDSDCG